MLGKKIACLVLVLCTVFSISAGAADINYVDHMSLVPPTYDYNVQPYGTNPPGSSADTHNLSVSGYNYQIDHIETSLYTSKWVTGATDLKVTVEDFTILNWGSGPITTLYVEVYNSSKKLVDSKTLIIQPRRYDSYGNVVEYAPGYAYLSGLSSSQKYYVKFKLGNTMSNNSVAFHGTISKY